MKKVKSLFITVCLSVVLLFTSGCSKGFTISFISDGETYHSVKLKGKDVVSLPEEPSKKGYEFKGWYFDENYNIKFNSDYYSKNKIENDVSLYARLDLIQYQISYNLAGGINDGNNPKSYNVNDSKIQLVNPYKQGYRFMGWYKETSYQNKVIEIDTSLCTNISLYAKWLKLYDIEYVLDGGVNNENNPSQYANDGNNITLLNPSKGGAEFLGWYLEDTFDNKVTEIDVTAESNLTFYARWVRAYSINYVCGIENCDLNDNPTSYITGDVNKALYPATSPNYRFDGWYSDSNFENKIEEVDTSIEKNITIYAKWTRINSINYTLDGGVNNPLNPLTFLKGDEIVILKEPTKVGYEFMGWYKESTFNNLIVTIDTTTDRDVTVYAKWKLIPYNISYDLNGGDANHEDNPSVYTADMKTFNLLEPTRKGYTFKGWYTDDTFETKIETIQKGTMGDISVIAKWEITNYLIVYHLDEGKNNGGNPTQYNINSEDISLLDPEKSGYAFLGWFEDAEFTIPYQAPINDKNNLRELHFYAKWELSHYIVSFDADGGVIKIITETEDGTVEQELDGYSYKYNITDYYVPFYTPTKTGYEFMGWYTDKTYTTKAESISDLGVGAFNLVAKWELNEYDIYYYLDGGVNHKDNPSKYNATSDVVIKDPTKEGYRFLGWYTDNTFTELQQTPQKGDERTYAFYAKWEIINYTIKLDANGGTVNEVEVYEYTYNIVNGTPLPYPIKEGHKFLGWYTNDSNDEKIEYINVGTTGDFNLIAKWENVTYSITYYLDGGVNHPDNPTQFTYGVETGILEPTKKGYRFVDWYTDETYQEVKRRYVGVEKTNEVYYAKWEIETYTITMDCNGGKVYGESTYSYTYNVNTQHDEKLVEATDKLGFVFIGWYLEESYITRVDKIEPETIGDINLYAKWELAQYKVTYHLDGGENDINNPTTYTVRQEGVITLYSPTKEGYAFKGWYKESTFQNKMDVIDLYTFGDLELYAKWELASYSITYDINLYDMEPYVEYYTADEAVYLQEFNISGYKFLGWYTNDIDEIKIEKIDVGNTANISVIAKWEIETYTITYELDGGSNHLDNPATYTINDEYPLKNPTREGYEFKGWFADEELTVEVNEILGENAQDIIIYAKWEPITQ